MRMRMSLLNLPTRKKLSLSELCSYQNILADPILFGVSFLFFLVGFLRAHWGCFMLTEPLYYLQENIIITYVRLVSKD